jgi:membrane protein YdbS with pleckstrin-like domain
MFERTRPLVLRFLKVPHDPDPPAGAPGSLLVFRAGRNYYKLRLLRWAIGQAGALAGIIFSLWLLNWLELQTERVRDAPSPAVKTSPPAPTPVDGGGATPTTPARTARANPQQRAHSAVLRLADRSPPWFFGLLRVVETVGVLLYLAQIPLTYALARLDYELRWYMVTDRSLRIRAGLTSVLESTMSFANVQQVVVTQGPLQRLLGLADVRVNSAGGGGGSGQHEQAASGGDSLHASVFHGVDNASQIRDLILERLRQFRAAGLGDPDDPATPPSPPPPAGASLGAAAQQLREQARALRATVSRL